MALSGKRGTRDEILDVAARMFATTGFKGTSLQDIAAGVGCSKATLLYHFDGKDALLAALIEPAMAALAELTGALDARAAEPAATVRDAAIAGLVGLALQYRREIPVLSADFAELVQHPACRALPGLIERLLHALAGRSDRLADQSAAMVVLAGIPAAVAITDDETTLIAIATRTVHDPMGS